MSATVFTSYKPEDYQQYTAEDCGITRPSLLDRFLTDPRTARMSLNHSTKMHIAILVKRGKILAEATNKLASRSNGAATRGSQNFIHAERNLIRTIGDTDKLKGADIYVMRIATSVKTGEIEFRYSQPCPECTVLMEKCLREYGLRHVYFTK